MTCVRMNQTFFQDKSDAFMDGYDLRNQINPNIHGHKYSQSNRQITPESCQRKNQVINKYQTMV